MQFNLQRYLSISSVLWYFAVVYPIHRNTKFLDFTKLARLLIRTSSKKRHVRISHLLKVKFRRKFMTFCAACRLCCINTDPEESSRQKVNFHQDLCSLPFSSNSLIEFLSNYTQSWEARLLKSIISKKKLWILSYCI